jgi:siroheme synthase (precorrin-2 oxidase/ferrochelatase)
MGADASDRVPRMAATTRDEIDALVGPATPHFAYQLRARIEELVKDLPEDDEIRRYGEAQMARLDRLGHASSKAEHSPPEPRTRPGWERIPSSAPEYDPLP